MFCPAKKGLNANAMFDLVPQTGNKCFPPLYNCANLQKHPKRQARKMKSLFTITEA